MTPHQRVAKHRASKKEIEQENARLKSRIAQLEQPIDIVIAARMADLTEDDLILSYDAMPNDRKARFASMLWDRATIAIIAGDRIYLPDNLKGRILPAALLGE
jgi:hypothetical protein